jgi:preprotein translocase subunit YajC
MFISPAYAQAAATGNDPSTFLQSGIIPIVLVGIIFYFMLIRPQQKRVKEHQAVLSAIRRGDRIVTNGGLVALVTKVNEGERQLEVEIADGVRVKVMRDMVSTVLSKTEPVADKGRDDKGDKGKDKAETKPE